ncbi:MAG: cell division transport system ATP-binding protein [Gaiellales bacterium]|nr:cell division transport system ATP-binding protein [Gaiellales bacterium]
MLKREEEHRETREAPAAPFAAVLDPPAPVIETAPGAAALTRAERLAALAAEDERAPRAPQRPGTPMIVFEKTSLVYPGDHVGLRSISLTIDKGEWVFLVGPSGSGKSTFIKLLLRELRATEGSVLVGGRSLEKLRRSKVPQLRRNIGCVFQDFKLLPNRNVYQNVAYALEVQGEDHSKIEHKVPEILQLVGLGEKLDRLPHELSGGEQQRVSIARAFVNHPALLICDEPTGNLDPDTSVGIMQLLYRINRSGTTVVMATHDRERVDKMRRRVIALEHGRLVRDDRRGGYV